MEKSKSLSRRREVLLLILIFATALAPRLWCFSRNLLPEGDAGNYLEVGRNLARGRGFTTLAKWDFYGGLNNLGPVVHPEGNRQPLLPLVVAATFKAGAQTPGAARALTLLASLGALALLYVLLRRWLGPKLALAGCALAALEPAFLWFSPRVQTEAYFVLLFFAALVVAGDFAAERPSLLRPLIVGVLLSLSYLFRLNGALLIVAYVVALGVAYRRRGVVPALLAVAAFAAAATPWWLRNAHVFGNPFYSQAKYFLFAPTAEQVWAFKRYVPTWSGFFASYDFFGLLGRYGRGLWRAVEPFLIGNAHFNELYEGAPLAAFVVLALFCGPLLRRRRALLFGALALLAHVVAFAAYGQGLFRYFVPFYLLIIPLGLTGAWRVAALFTRRRKWATAALFALLLLPLVRPIGKTLAQDDRAEFRKMREVAVWLAANTKPDDVVVTWPRVIELLYDYDRPTLYWPGGGTREMLAVLAQYKTRYVVVEPLALALRPNLRPIWREGTRGIIKIPSERGGGSALTIVRVDYGADAFKQAFRGEGGDVVVYEVDHDKLRETVYGVYLGGVH